MKYCEFCNLEFAESERSCPKCSRIPSGKARFNPAKVYSANASVSYSKQDSPSILLAIFSFFFAIFGFIIFAGYQSTQPQRANSCLVGAITGVLVQVAVGILIIIIYAAKGYFS